MRHSGISVVLITLAVLFICGCSGDPASTGVPVYNLPGNNDAPADQTPSGPRLTAITIEPAAVNIENGGKQIFKAYGAYSDNAVIDITGMVTWYSSNEAAGDIDDHGVFTTAGLGYAGVGAYLETSGTIVYANYAFANIFGAGTMPPEPVRDVKAKFLSNGQSFISWALATDPSVKGYNVYKTRTSGVGYDTEMPLNDELVTRLNYFIDINPGGGICYYVVAAVNMDDEVGAFSTEVELDWNPEDPWEDE